MRRTILLTMSVVLLITGSALAGNMWVKSRYARLRAGTSSRDAVVARLRHGQPVSVVEDKGGFAKVKLADGKTGWVSKTWLTDKQPARRDAKLAALGAAARNDGSKISYTAGARGLAPEAKTYAASKGNAKAAAAALERLEKLTISDDELERFIASGKLGDYREVR